MRACVHACAPLRCDSHRTHTCTCVHRRVLDAMYRGVVQPGIFLQSDLPRFVSLLDDAATKFEDAHKQTYLTSRFTNSGQ